MEFRYSIPTPNIFWISVQNKTITSGSRAKPCPLKFNIRDVFSSNLPETFIARGLAYLCVVLFGKNIVLFTLVNPVENFQD